VGVLKQVLTRIGLVIVIAVAAILLVGIVTVGGYALYIWIAHPSSFAVPFHS